MIVLTLKRKSIKSTNFEIKFTISPGTGHVMPDSLKNRMHIDEKG